MSSVALELIDVDPPTFEGVNDIFYEKKWTDGLPIIPPTQERVKAMLAASPLPGDKLFGDFPPRWRPTSVEQIAVNAVMAGCRPEYFPVVLASIDAILDPAFNLYGLQATTNPAGVMLVVNGPLARKLNINSGFNLFGQGWRSNATIGRAVRLCMINIGGGLPGIGDMTPLGNPNKYGSCIAENEGQTPWDPFHVEKGFSESTSTVTAVAAMAPQNMIVLSAGAKDILDGLATAFHTSGSNCMHFTSEVAVVLGPVHAKHIAEGGFDKAAVRQYLWEGSKITIDHLPATDLYAVHGWKRDCIHLENGREVMYVTERPEDIAVFVAGGTVGPHSAVIPTFNNTHLITRKIG
jgi:hypothetical protein